MLDRPFRKVEVMEAQSYNCAIMLIETDPEVTGLPQIELKELIKSIRKEQGLNQKEMADKLNVSRSTYEFWEIGKYPPDSKSLLKLLLMRAKNRKLNLKELFS